MKNAYECTEEFDKNGRCLRRQRAFGPILVWGIVAVLIIVTGYKLVPATFWHFLP